MDSPKANIGGFTGRELAGAYWWVTHRELVHKVLVGFLIFLNVIFWGYALYGLTRYFLVDWNRRQALLRDAGRDYVNYQYWREQNQPAPLAFSGIQILPLGEGRYDLAVSVANNNPLWAVTSLQYSFDFANREKPAIREAWFLPGESKYLVDLGVAAKFIPNDINFKINAIKWQRVGDIAAKQAEALNFVISDIKFQSADELKAGKLPISKTSFKVTNNSPYNYWAFNYYILLYSGSRLVGINYLTHDYLDSGETVALEANWFGALSRPDKVEVVPNINILDRSVFRPLTGEGESKGGE
ncbi:MAG: hypothetical protein WCT37_01715 [Patescibacteria group bacterium]|jgi:hypothetical protein